MKPTYDAVLNNPNLLPALLAEARRERALAVHRLVLAPLKGFFAHAPRPHLAPAGKAC